MFTELAPRSPFSHPISHSLFFPWQSVLFLFCPMWQTLYLYICFSMLHLDCLAFIFLLRALTCSSYIFYTAPTADSVQAISNLPVVLQSLWDPHNPGSLPFDLCIYAGLSLAHFGGRP
jgi:hypothetical protein